MEEQLSAVDQAEIKETQKLWFNRAAIACSIVSIIATILMLVSLGMLALSMMASHMHLNMAWLQSAHQGWFSEQGHFFHVFLYNLLILIVLTIISNVAVRLMKKIDQDATIHVRFLFLYIGAMVSAEIASFILFIHTVSEVAPK